MNKDVIYIEPEDDITDIITKIENSKEKIVALVPPKKAGVFRSAVNIKLIAKVGTTSEKTIVLVTTDPSVIKLAATAKIPVTKNLQSAPTIPAVESIAEETAVEDVAEESDKKDEDAEEGGDEDSDEEDEKKSSEAEDEKPKAKKEKTDSAKKKGEKSTKQAGNPFIAWVKEHKKLAIICGICGLLLILVLIWAIAIAPAATLTVEIRTTSNNFSENISFTTNLDEENSTEGKFYLDEKKIESVQEVEFEATGTKNVGEKASGDVVVYAYFPITSVNGGKIAINAGSRFSVNGLSYVSDKDITLSWDGDLETLRKDCENFGEPSLRTSGCLVSGRVAVTAEASGSKYNIAATNTGWSTTANVAVYSDKAMSGGTDKTITVVQQSDIDKAKGELASTNEAENKEKLYETLNDGMLVIDSSFIQTTGEAVSTPAVGEQVEDGKKATLKATTITSVYVIDKTKVEEFITEKANLPEDKKIYEMKDPFIENFLKNGSGYSGKLKTSYSTGPKITENDVIEAVKGKGLGEAQHDLKDIDGISSVRIDTSFPWVMSIPSDPNKITVNLEVKE